MLLVTRARGAGPALMQSFTTYARKRDAIRIFAQAGSRVMMRRTRDVIRIFATGSSRKLKTRCRCLGHDRAYKSAERIGSEHPNVGNSADCCGVNRTLCIRSYMGGKHHVKDVQEVDVKCIKETSHTITSIWSDEDFFPNPPIYRLYSLRFV